MRLIQNALSLIISSIFNFIVFSRVKIALIYLVCNFIYMLKKINLKVNFEGRIFGLDLIRAFAILMVVYCHGYKFISDFVEEKTYMYFYINGVTVFFVLSGYLIGNIFINQINPEFSLWAQLMNFWKRRWFRTLPNYFLMLTFLVIYFDRMHGYSYYHSIKYFFFLQNMFEGHPAFFGEAWSLAVEEWFYLLIPLLFLLLYKLFKMNKQNTLLTVIVLFIVLPLVIRLIGHLYIKPCNEYSFDHYFSKLVFMRLDSIMIGFAGAYLKVYHPKKWESLNSSWWIGILLILLTHLMHVFQSYENSYSCFFDRTISFTMMSLGVVMLMPVLSVFQPAKWTFWHKSISFISIISYSLYLVNLTIFKSIFSPIYNNIFQNVISDHFIFSIGKYMYYWILCILMAYLLYIIWERPWLKLRDK